MICRREHLFSRAALVGALLAALLFFFCVFQLDNKYSESGPQGENGVFPYCAGQLSEQPAFLIDGWEVCAGIILPEDFIKQDVQTVSIGQYSDFSFLTGFPYGTATYRITLRNIGDAQTMTVYLPEVFCAAKVYVDRKLAAQSGSFSPYRPLARDLTVTFPADGDTELVVQVANYTHYHGGLFFIPVLGSPDVVTRMAAIRLAFYAMLCFGLLAVSLFSTAVWVLFRHDQPTFWLGALSFAYTLTVSYPFLQLARVPVVRMRYALEDAAASAMIFCAVCFVSILSDVCQKKFYRTLVLPVCGGFLLMSAVAPLWVLPHLPGFLPFYDALITFYELTAAAYLVICAFRAECTGRLLMLTGSVFFGTTLFCAALSAGIYEPAQFAWPREYGGFVLVLIFGILMVRRNRQIFLENERLTSHLQEEVAHKTQGLSTLLAERKQFLSDVTHDLKIPITSVRNYIRMIELSGAPVDGKIRSSLDAISIKFEDMNTRIGDLQRFTAEDEAPLEMRPICLNELLADYHRLNRPDVEVTGADFLLHLPVRQYFIRGDRDRLCRLLENLVYNAVSFVGEGDSISLSLEGSRTTAVIKISDTGPGIPESALPNLFKRFYSTRPEGGGRGLGLFIAKSIALEHGGDISVTSTEGKGTTFSICFPLEPDR